MKTVKIIMLLMICSIISTSAFAQRGRGHHPHGGRGHGHGGKKVVVVKRSPFRPKKVVVYHPVWHPKWSCNRRWVFFPKYNIYWDNWRNHYMFWNGVIWISQPTAPPVIVNVNLANEKNYELKENHDDNDEIGASNDSHKKEYKPE